MPKKREYSDESEDEEKERRRYKRLKRAERKFRKQEKRYRRMQERNQERGEISSESGNYEHPSDIISEISVPRQPVITADANCQDLSTAEGRGNFQVPSCGVSTDLIPVSEPLTRENINNEMGVENSSLQQDLRNDQLLNTELPVSYAVSITAQGAPSLSGNTESLAPTKAAMQNNVNVQSSLPQSDLPAAATSTKDDEVLGDKILELMGKRLTTERINAPDIHKDLAVRWQEILLKGLPMEERKQLVEKYPPPGNCTTIDPPKLNAEVKASLSEAIVKKDARVVTRQERITACIAALAKSLSLILTSNSPENLVLFAILSDSARLLVDVQHDDSLIRRSLILSNLNSSLRDMLNSTVVDEWLFGKNLEEQLKAAKLLERSTKDLKPEQSSDAKNFRGPPGRPPFKKQQATQGGHAPHVPRKQTGQSNYRKSFRGQSRGYHHQGQQKKFA